MDRLTLADKAEEGGKPQMQEDCGNTDAARRSTATAAPPSAADADAPVRLLVFFLNRLLNFRHAEVEALVSLDEAPPYAAAAAGAATTSTRPPLPPSPPPPLVPPPPPLATAPLQLPSPPPNQADLKWERPHGNDPFSPFWHATFPSQSCAVRAASRAALIRGIFEPWAEASTMRELEAALRALPESRRLPWSERDSSDGRTSRTFKLVVEGWGAKMHNAARKAATLRSIVAAGLNSRVDLTNPDDVFWLIVAPGNVDQGYVAAPDSREGADAAAVAAAAAAADAPGGGGGDGGNGDGGGGGGKSSSNGYGGTHATRRRDNERWYEQMFCEEEEEEQGSISASNGAPHPNPSTLPYRAPTRLYFCRQVAICDRTAIVHRFNLSERPYIGPTSMDPEMAAVMANCARAKGGQMALDPFCGTGSILVALAAAGARVVGADIDVKVLREGHSADGNAAAALAARRPKNAPKRRTERRMIAEAAEGGGEGGEGQLPILPVPPKPPVASDVLSNFDYYGLAPRLIDLVRLDAHRPLLRPQLSGCFDAIVADPPYGVRAGGRKSERIDGAIVCDRASHVARTLPYGLTECLEDLLDLSARLLRPGGRLVYFMPAVVPGGEAAAAARAAVRAARRQEEEGGGGGGGGGGGVAESSSSEVGRGEGGGEGKEEEEEEGEEAGGKAAALKQAGDDDSSRRAAGSRAEAEGEEGDDGDDLSSSSSDDDDDALLGREPPTHPCLAHVATCEQSLSTRYARRLVVMERTERAYSAEESAKHREACRGRLAALSDGLMAAVKLPRAAKLTRRERRARRAASSAPGAATGRGKHV
jgi:tRNA G10  N-methylase Trm11